MDNIENIEYISDEDDNYSDDSLFNITSWGSDLSFRELITMYDEDELLKPELQRNYVWKKLEASRFIESILMGLPVPSIFLAQSGSQKLIVDGFQRILTIRGYVKGIFPGDEKVFKLTNSPAINERWRNKAFNELTQDEQRRIKSTTIHSIIFEQKEPKNDDTSMYQVFERINTSGRSLTPQEIRNCVYQGKLNTLLFELNKNKAWRALIGSENHDPRMADLECILRFFLMKSDIIQNNVSNQISLKKELNTYMGKYRNTTDENLQSLKEDFEKTMDVIFEKLGPTAFRNISNNQFVKMMHPAIFDAVSVAYFKAIQNGVTIKNVEKASHISLLNDLNFHNMISERTTNLDNIRGRINLAYHYLIGE